jgi:creatinine amidohydrolase
MAAVAQDLYEIRARPVHWADLASPEIGALFLERPNEVGLVPVGATEQHGPHLPTGTDTILASAICDAVSSETGAPVLPAVAVGCSFGHGTATPGTLSLTPELLADTVRAIADWAAHSGLRRLIFVNGHFGNAAALGIATDHIRLERPDLRAGFFGWWDIDEEIASEVFADGDDIHANRAETSLMLAVAPELVHIDRVEGADDPDRSRGLVFRYTATDLSKNGVTGEPSKATLPLGKRLFSHAVEVVTARVEAGRSERSPLGERSALVPTAIGLPK